MNLTLRRTHASNPEQDAELPPTIDVGGLHALLYQQGKPDLAALLARFRRRHSRPTLFRSYRRLLDADQAQHLDLAIAFLLGAGHAGCRVYPDPRSAAAPPTLLRLVSDQAAGAHEVGDADADDQVTSTDTSSTLHASHGIMPSWLATPRGSSWDR